MFLVVFIAILYVIGFVFRWNYSVWWYDWLLHLLGGMWVAFMAGHFFKNPLRQLGWPTGILFLIAIAALVGVGWEIYEFTLDELFFKEAARWRAQAGNTDSMTDLIMDLAGGIAATGYITYRFYWSDKSKKKNEI